MSEVSDVAESAMEKLGKQNFEGYEVLAYIRDHALTRFANSVIHQQVQSKVFNVRLRAYKGKKMFEITGSALQDNLDNLVGDLVAILPNVPSRSFFQGFAEDQSYKKIESNGKLLNADERAEVVETAVNIASEVDRRALLYGKVETLDFNYAIANSNGIEGRHSFAYNDYKVLSIIDEGNRGFGREEVGSKDPNTVNIEELTRSAVNISRDTLLAKSVAPGDYEVVLRQNASIELLSYSLMGLNAQMFHQKNSPYSDRIGEQVLSDKLTIKDLPHSKDSLMPSPFDGDGMATANRDIIENGVPKQIFYDISSASQFLDDKRLSSAHAVLPFSDYMWLTALPSCTTIKKGDASESEMIEDTKNGLLVQTFWYSNTVNMIEGVITGLTRDGLYLIENGEIKYAVKNMRYTDSLLKFFNKIDLVENKHKSMINPFGVSSQVPMMKLSNLKFTGQSKH